MNGSPPRWEAILLAAGASRRMGAPKALLPWSGRRLLEHQVLEILATRVSRVVVVLGAHREQLLPLVERGVRTLGGSFQGGSRLAWVMNADWPSGKCSSIRCGAGAVSPRSDHILLAAVDQPLAAEVLEAIFAAHERAGRAITIPRVGGRRGHPVAVRALLVDELKRLSEEREGLRYLVREAERKGELNEVEIAAEPVLWNLNRPDQIPGRARPAGGARGTEVLWWVREQPLP